MLGEVDDDDPASVERVRQLLAPIDNVRARASASGGGGTEAKAAEEVVEEEEDDGDGPEASAGA